MLRYTDMFNYYNCCFFKNFQEDGSTSYFMNQDGLLDPASSTHMDSLTDQVLPAPIQPPPQHNNMTNPHNAGLKNFFQDVQLKRQKEIRDLMKKKREKAVLVDRISRWLFPTSFILLNIVYWALFGDHNLW